MRSLARIPSFVRRGLFTRFGWETDEAFDRQRGAQAAVFPGELIPARWEEH